MRVFKVKYYKIRIIFFISFNYKFYNIYNNKLLTIIKIFFHIYEKIEEIINQIKYTYKYILKGKKNKIP